MAGGGEERPQHRVCSKAGDETGGLDIEERRARAEACLPTELAYLLLQQAWMASSQRKSAKVGSWNSKIS